MNICVSYLDDDLCQVWCDSVGMQGSRYMVQFSRDLFTEFRIQEFVDLVTSIGNGYEPVSVIYQDVKDDDAGVSDDAS